MIRFGGLSKPPLPPPKKMLLIFDSEPVLDNLFAFTFAIFFYWLCSSGGNPTKRQKYAFALTRFVRKIVGSDRPSVAPLEIFPRVTCDQGVFRKYSPIKTKICYLVDL